MEPGSAEDNHDQPFQMRLLAYPLKHFESLIFGHFQIQKHQLWKEFCHAAIFQAGNGFLSIANDIDRQCYIRRDQSPSQKEYVVFVVFGYQDCRFGSHEEFGCATDTVKECRLQVRYEKAGNSQSNMNERYAG